MCIRDRVDGVDPRTGQPVRYRTTKSQKALDDLNQDLEKMLALNKLLMDGFDFTKIKEQGKEERDDEVLDVLNRRAKKKTKKSQVRNGWTGE